MRLISGLFVVLLSISCTKKEKAADTQSTKQPSAKEQVQVLQNDCMTAAQTIQKRQSEKSLYERLGKDSKIRSFASKLFNSHKSNKNIGHMFANVNEENFVENVTKFLVMGTGGKADYKGRDMKTAHANLGITHQDFLWAGGDVQAVMKELNYGENEIQEVVCALVSFIPVVVTK